MRRVVVPLDGSDLAEAIIPDARRLAGSDGELVLVRIVSSQDAAGKHRRAQASDVYLDSLARRIRATGADVQTSTLVKDNVAEAIDAAVTEGNSEIVACATYERSSLYRLVHGSVAWSVLAHSPVPVLIRHFQDSVEVCDSRDVNLPRRILVPLDGSSLAEKALPLAQELSVEWQASISLAQAVSDVTTMYAESLIRAGIGPYEPADLSSVYPDNRTAAEEYLTRVAERVPGDVDAEVLTGPPVYALTTFANERSITDVVMASHGHTGLARFFLGSVAYEMVHHLTCSVIVVPMAAAERASTA
jgi:nucleotide-binding universal stress UspA family protein